MAKRITAKRASGLAALAIVGAPVAIAATPVVASASAAGTDQALPDVSFVTAGKTATIDVTGNDSIPDGAKVAKLAVNAQNSGDGKWSVTSDNKVTFAPASGFSGLSIATYAGMDDKGNAFSSAVMVYVAPPAAAASAATSGSTDTSKATAQGSTDTSSSPSSDGANDGASDSGTSSSSSTDSPSASSTDSSSPSSSSSNSSSASGSSSTDSSSASGTSSDSSSTSSSPNDSSSSSSSTSGTSTDTGTNGSTTDNTPKALASSAAVTDKTDVNKAITLDPLKTAKVSSNAKNWSSIVVTGTKASDGKWEVTSDKKVTFTPAKDFQGTAKGYFLAVDDAGNYTVNTMSVDVGKASSSSSSSDPSSSSSGTSSSSDSPSSSAGATSGTSGSGTGGTSSSDGGTSTSGGNGSGTTSGGGNGTGGGTSSSAKTGPLTQTDFSDAVTSPTAWAGIMLVGGIGAVGAGSAIVSKKRQK